VILRGLGTLGVAAVCAVAGSLVGYLAGGGEPAAALPEPVAQLDRTVVVVDRTDGTWSGVPSAAHSWSRSGKVNVVMRPRCHTNRYCVVFQHPSSYPGAKWLGWWRTVSRNVALIDLNAGDPRSADPHVQQWIACHELGHVLGVGEVYDGDAGCMVDDWRRAPQEATDRDLQMLQQTHHHGAPEGTALRFIYR